MMRVRRSMLQHLHAYHVSIFHLLFLQMSVMLNYCIIKLYPCPEFRDFVFFCCQKFTKTLTLGKARKILQDFLISRNQIQPSQLEVGNISGIPRSSQKNSRSSKVIQDVDEKTKTPSSGCYPVKVAAVLYQWQTGAGSQNWHRNFTGFEPNYN